MYYLKFLISLVFIFSFSVFAKTTDTPSATYILQVSSNLQCDSLNIELVSKFDGTSHYIQYGSGAFAAAELRPGDYAFGDVVCKNQQQEQRFDLLKGEIAPLTVSNGQVYYGGRIILEQVVHSKKRKMPLCQMQISRIPKTRSHCSKSMSRVRGYFTDHCDGTVKVNRVPSLSKQLKAYVADTANKDIAALRKALAISDAQLHYLPLKV